MTNFHFTFSHRQNECSINLKCSISEEGADNCIICPLDTLDTLETWYNLCNNCQKFEYSLPDSNICIEKDRNNILFISTYYIYNKNLYWNKGYILKRITDMVLIVLMELTEEGWIECKKFHLELTLFLIGIFILFAS